MPNLLCALRRMDKPITVSEMLAKKYDMAIIIGHLGRDPETRVTATGKTVTKTTVAVSWGKRGDPDQRTEWVELVAWEEKGEHLEGFKKGDAIEVYGKLSVNTWTGKDGEARETGQLTVWGVATPIYRRQEAKQVANSDTENEIPF